MNYEEVIRSADQLLISEIYEVKEKE